MTRHQPSFCKVMSKSGNPVAATLAYGSKDISVTPLLNEEGQNIYDSSVFGDLGDSLTDSIFGNTILFSVYNDHTGATRLSGDDVDANGRIFIDFEEDTPMISWGLSAASKVVFISVGDDMDLGNDPFKRRCRKPGSTPIVISVYVVLDLLNGQLGKEVIYRGCMNESNNPYRHVSDTYLRCSFDLG